MSRLRRIHRTAGRATAGIAVAVTALLASSLLVFTGVTAADASARAVPDLRVASVTNPPATRLPGQEVRSVVVVKNLGRGRATKSTTTLWLSKNRTVGAGDRKLSSRATKSLARSRSTRVVLTSRIPSSTQAGKYFVIACADAKKKIRERSEGNNCRASRRPLEVVRASLTITAPVDRAIVGPSVAVSFVSKVRLTTSCSIDHGPATRCASGVALHLAEGPHAITIAGTDAAGRVVTASRSFTVDATAPSLSLLDTPASITRDSTPSVSFTSDDAAATYSCSIDGAQASPCTSPFTSAQLADGAHRIEIVATDTVGNSDHAVAEFSVDATAPVLTFSSPPPTRTSDTTPTFEFAADEAGSSTTCRIDGASFAACSSPFTTGVLSSGSHTIDIQASDLAGNVSDVLSHVVTVDTTAPNTTIDDRPGSATNDATPGFAFTSDEAGSTFECRVLPAAFSACQSPFATAPLSAGTYTFEVRAIDGADNVDATPAAFTFTVDLTAPDTTLTSTPSAITDDPTADFTFTSTEAGTFECRINTGAFTSCASPYATASLEDGGYTFEVRAVDAAGNVDPTPASHTFQVDTRAPNTVLTQTPASLTNNPSAVFGFSSNDSAATFECKVDAAAYTPCTSPFTTPALSDGTHTVSVRAVRNGLRDLTPESFTFAVDHTEPQTTLTSTEPNPTNDETADFTFTSNEAGSTFQCRVDNGAYASCTSPFSTPPTGGGTHTFSVRAIDPAGNVDSSPATHTWMVDVIPPITSVTAAPTNPTTDRTADFTFSSSESGTFMCRLNSAPYAPCTSPYTTASLSDGTYTFSVYAVDAAGNVDATPESRSFRVDATGPTFSISSPAAADSGSYITKDSTIDLAGFPYDATGITSVTWSNSAGGSGSALSAAGNWMNFQIWDLPLAVGVNTITITGTDTLGNVNQKVVVVTRDASAPAVTITIPTAESTFFTAAPVVTLRGTATDNLAIASVVWSNSRGGSGTATGTTPWSAMSIPLAVGANTITVTATDTAGNSSTASIVVTRDNTGPMVSISTNGGANYSTSASTVQLTGSASDPTGIAEVTWRIPSTGSTGVASGTTSWTTTINLNPGPNYIEVTAYDRVGNATTTSIEITRT